MKNIYLISLLYKPNIGGVENSLSALAQEFKSTGYNVQILCSNLPSTLKSYEIIDDIPVFRYKWKSHFLLIFPFNIFINILFISKWLKTKIDRKEDIEIISRDHLMCIALLNAGFNKIKYIVPEIILKKSSVKLTFKSRFLMLFNGYLQKVALKFCKTYVFSDNVRRQIKNIGVKVPNTMLRPGVEKEKFHFNKREMREFLGIPENKIVFLGLGRFIEDKGYGIAIEAFHKLDNDDALLILVGEGPLKRTFERLCFDLDILEKVLILDKTQFPGHFYSASDIFLMTSLNEAFGQTIIEACFAQRPIIAFKAGEYKKVLVQTASEEILANQIGVTYCLPDVDSLSDAMKNAIAEFKAVGYDILYQSIERKYSWSTFAKDILC